MGIHKHDIRTKTEQLIEAVQSLEAAIRSLSGRIGGPITIPVPIKQEKDK